MSRAAADLRVAACLYVRNEGPDIAEWLAFHHVVGIDHVLVFDNSSTDDTRAKVRQAARNASITLLPWPITDKRAQKLAYVAGLRWLARYDWVAFLDADEFLTPTGETGLKSVLAACGDAAGVAVNWAMFGSGGHDAAPAGLQIEAFTRRAEDAFPENRLMKSIVRPRAAKPVTPHRFDLPGPYVRPDGTPAVWQGDDRSEGPPDYGLLQVNHYFTRSREHWRRKMARGYRDIVRPEDAFAQYDRNEREDLSAARFAEAVRAELARRGQD